MRSPTLASPPGTAAHERKAVSGLVPLHGRDKSPVPPLSSGTSACVTEQKGAHHICNPDIYWHQVLPARQTRLKPSGFTPGMSHNEH